MQLSYEEYKRLKESSCGPDDSQKKTLIKDGPGDGDGDGQAGGYWHKQRQDLIKGGPGSGNFEHEGRPGEVGGSGTNEPGHGSFLGDMASGVGHVIGRTAADLGGGAIGTVAGWELGKKFTPQIIAGIGRLLGIRPERAEMLARLSTRIPVVRDMLSYTMGSIGAGIGYPLASSTGRAIFDYLANKGVDEHTSPSVLAAMDFSDAPKFDTEHLQKGGPGSGNFEHEGRPGEVGGSGSDEHVGPEGTDRSIARTLTGTVGGYLGYAAGSEVAGALHSLKPFGVSVLRASASKIPLAARLIGLLNPGGIVGGMIGGAVADYAVQMLFDYLDDKGVESPGDIQKLSPQELQDAPTLEDAHAAMQQKEHGHKVKDTGMDYQKYRMKKSAQVDAGPDMSDGDIRDYCMKLQLNLSPEEIQDIIDMDLSKKQLDKLLGMHGSLGLSKGLAKVKKTMSVEPPAEQMQPMQKGGPGSGFFGHRGSPGQNGGSAHSKGTPPPPFVQIQQQRPGATGQRMPIRKAYDDQGYYYDEGDQSGDYQPYQGNWWENPANNDQGNIVPIDQMNDNSYNDQYAQAPASQASDAGGQQGDNSWGQWWRDWLDGKHKNTNPLDYPPAGEQPPEPYDQSKQPKIDKPKTEKEQTKDQIEAENILNGKSAQYNDNGTITLSTKDGPSHTFRDLDQARKFYELERETARTLPKAKPSLWERATTSPEGAVDAASDLYGQYMPEFLGGNPPEGRPYDPKERTATPKPPTMPPYVVGAGNRVSVFKPDGTTEVYPDLEAAYQKFGGANPKIEPMMTTPAPEPPKEPLPGFGASSTYRGDGYSPGDVSPTNDRPIQLSPLDSPTHKQDLAQTKMIADRTGQTIELPSLPRGEPMSAQELADWEKKQDRYLNYDEYKARRQRGIAAEEANAENLQMDQDIKRLQHDREMTQLQRQAAGNWPTPTPSGQGSGQVRQADNSSGAFVPENSGARRPVPARNAGVQAAPDAVSAGADRRSQGRGVSTNEQAKRSVQNYASTKGIQVSEQNGDVIMRLPNGKTLRFDDFSAAQAYFEGTNATQKIQKDFAPDEGGMVDMQSFHYQAAQMGAEVMMQKNGSMIVFAPDWNPPLAGKQFKDAGEAQAWLNEEYAARGNEQPMEKGFTPLDQADVLPPVRKKAKTGESPQLTANLGLQESVSYAQYRSARR